MAAEMEIKLSLTPVALNQAAEWQSAQTGVRIDATNTPNNH